MVWAILRDYALPHFFLLPPRVISYPTADSIYPVFSHRGYLTSRSRLCIMARPPEANGLTPFRTNENKPPGGPVAFSYDKL